MTQSKLIAATSVPGEYGFSARQIRRWCAEAKLRRVKPSGSNGPTFLYRADLEELIEEFTLPVGVKAKNSTKRKKSAKRR